MRSFLDSILASFFSMCLLICYGWLFLDRGRTSIIVTIFMTVIVFGWALLPKIVQSRKRNEDKE